MTKFVVTTQSLENYGAQSSDGSFSNGNAYWKCKGGVNIIVEGLERYQDAWAFVAAIAPNGIGFKEVPVACTDYDTWLDNLRSEWKDDEAFEYFRDAAFRRVVNPADPATYKDLVW